MRPHNPIGAGFVAAKAFQASAVLITMLALVACTPEKDRLDAEAKRLCAIDGGIKIYETAVLPRDKFHEKGTPKVPIGNDNTGFGYLSRGTQEHLAGQIGQQAGDGAGLKRFTTQIVRSTDGKVMGESRVYGRHGGNFLDGYLQRPGFQCPTFEEVRNLSSEVFVKGQKK